jgi:hypothetical protein
MPLIETNSRCPREREMVEWCNTSLERAFNKIQRLRQESRDKWKCNEMQPVLKVYIDPLTLNYLKDVPGLTAFYPDHRQEDMGYTLFGLKCRVYLVASHNKHFEVYR